MLSSMTLHMESNYETRRVTLSLGCRVALFLNPTVKLFSICLQSLPTQPGGYTVLLALIFPVDQEVLEDLSWYVWTMICVKNLTFQLESPMLHYGRDWCFRMQSQLKNIAQNWVRARTSMPYLQEF